MQFNFRIDRADISCLDKQSTDAQISNSRCVLHPAAAPDDVHTLGRINTVVVSSGMKNFLFQHTLARVSRFPNTIQYQKLRLNDPSNSAAQFSQEPYGLTLRCHSLIINDNQESRGTCVEVAKGAPA